MSNPLFIQELLDNPMLWRMPEKVSPDDISWENAWTGATEASRKNLARGWLWCVIEYCKENVSLSMFGPFSDCVEKHLEWIQTIQPYLDADFFSTHQASLDWKKLSTFLVTGTADEDPVLACHREFFFGSETAQKEHLPKVLQHAKEDYAIAPRAVSRHAWKIAQDDSELIAHAKHLSFTIGHRFHSLPTNDLPQTAYFYQLFGYLAKTSTTTTLDPSIPSRQTLREMVRALPASEAASLLLTPLREHCYKGVVTHRYHLRTDSLLTFELHTDDPYLTLKDWLPSSVATLERAELLDLHPVEACTSIALESAAQKVENTITLPDNVSSEFLP